MVLLYALSTCPWCKKTKQLLEEQKVTFDCIEVDLISGDAQKHALEEVKKLTGKNSFPVLVINDVVIQGFKPEEIKEALKSEA